MAEVILPERFRKLKWGQQIPEDLKNMLLKYIKEYTAYSEEGQGPSLFGKPGIGKSYCAALVAVELAHKGIDCLWVPTVHKLNYLLDLRDFRKDSYFGNKQKLLDTDFIVLDDFGQLRDFPRIRELFFEIVDHRYAWRKPTMFTANFAANSTEELETEISKCFNTALTRRILTMSKGLIYSA